VHLSKCWRGTYISVEILKGYMLISRNSEGVHGKKKVGNPWFQGRIQPVRLGEGAISIIFGIQVSQRLRYCKRYEVYFTKLLWQSNGWQNGLISRMSFFELYKIVVNKVTFVGFRSAPAWLRQTGDFYSTLLWIFCLAKSLFFYGCKIFVAGLWTL